MTGHMRGDARKRSLESQHRLRIVNGLIVSCMCGAATNTDPYGDAVTTHIIAEARADGARQALLALAADIDPSGYGWTSVKDAERFKARLKARAAAAAIRGVR